MLVSSNAEIVGRFTRLKSRYARRDAKMAQVYAVRDGRMAEIAPDLFPDTGPFQAPITANMIDVAARDISETIAPLPSVNCRSPHMVKDGDQRKADLRTQIVQGYISTSDLQVQAYTGADDYITAGFLPGRIIIDDERQTPIIDLVDPTGCYPEIDRFGRVHAMYRRFLIEPDELRAQYPEHRASIDEHFRLRDESMVEVLEYQDDERDVMLVPSIENQAGAGCITLLDVPNRAGRCLWRVAQRPGRSKRGQFDDVLFVQLAKARFALLAMEAAHKSVQAPIVVPTDVPNIPLGPDAVIRTSNPAGVGRIKLDVPREAFGEQAQLDSELRIGTRYPEVRTGNTDAGVITGRGVQALMGTMDTQVRTAQAVLARFYADLLALALEVDEKVWPNVTKTLEGRVNGTPFEIRYKPSRDIAGDTTVDVQFGLMAGLDPNRWLVFGLQARAEKLISRDYLRRQMPADLDAGEEERKVDIEDYREALKQAMAGYAQAIPVLAQQGQDPREILRGLKIVIDGRRAGKMIEDTIEDAFAPEEPEIPEVPEGAEGGGEGGQPPYGLGPTGLLKGVAPGQAGQAPGGRPDLQMMLAGLDSRGQAQISAGVSRRVAF